MSIDELTLLVTDVQKQEEGAFDYLYTYCYRYVVKCCLGKGLNHADSQDIAQEVMLSMYHNIMNLREPHCFRKWLLCIVHSQYCKFIRRSKQTQALNDKIEFKEMRSYMTPENCIEKLGYEVQIQDALQPMKKKLKEVVILRYLKEFSEEEIANYCSLPKGTVKSRLFYARQELQKKSAYTI